MPRSKREEHGARVVARWRSIRRTLAASQTDDALAPPRCPFVRGCRLAEGHTGACDPYMMLGIDWGRMERKALAFATPYGTDLSSLIVDDLLPPGDRTVGSTMVSPVGSVKKRVKKR